MFTFLGNLREAIVKVRLFVESESAFFNGFTEEGMTFNSLLYLMLIWIRVLKYIFQNPSQFAERMKNFIPASRNF